MDKDNTRHLKEYKALYEQMKKEGPAHNFYNGGDTDDATNIAVHITRLKTVKGLIEKLERYRND